MEKLSEKDIESNNRVYDLMASKGDPDFWYDNHKEENYERLLRIEFHSKRSLKGKSCLDVGCGTGDFSEVLRRKEAAVYVGIDVYLPSLELAAQKYPDEKFIKMDILNDDPGQFDFVFCSGALSTRMDSDNYRFIEAMIRSMWQSARIGVAFNFLVGDEYDADIFYYSFNLIEAVCKRIMGDEGILHSLRNEEDEAHMYMCRVNKE